MLLKINSFVSLPNPSGQKEKCMHLCNRMNYCHFRWICTTTMPTEMIERNENEIKTAKKKTVTLNRINVFKSNDYLAIVCRTVPIKIRITKCKTSTGCLFVDTHRTFSTRMINMYKNALHGGPKACSTSLQRCVVVVTFLSTVARALHAHINWSSFD